MSGSSDDKIERLKDHAERILGREREQRGGGSGNGDGMDSRVTKLETHMEYVRRDLGDIREALKVLPNLATKRDLESWRWQWIATGVAIVALIIGGMGWLSSRPLPQASPPSVAQSTVPITPN